MNIYFNPSSDLTFDDIQYCSFNVTLSSNTLLPFFAIYTQRKNYGSDSGSWYGAKNVYEVFNPPSIPINNPVSNPTPYQFYCRVSGENIDHMPKFGFQLQELPPGIFSVGTISPTDKLLAVSIHTDSSASLNSENFVLHNLAITTKSQTYNYNFAQSSLVDATITASLNAEIQRATAKEGELLLSLNAQISKEAGDIATVNGSSTQLSTTLNTAIGAEKTRAEGVENSIKSQIDGINTTITGTTDSVSSSLTTLTNNLQSEITNRTNGDSTLTTRISNVEKTLISFLQHYFGNSTYSSSSTFPLTFPNAHA
jgi:hypothetical protein